VQPEEKRRWKGECRIMMINIQGLTEAKYVELCREVKKRTVLCLVETQKKFLDFQTDSNLDRIDSMREIGDRKGGGIMVLYKEEESLHLQKREEGHADVLRMEGRIGGMRVTIIVVYLRTGSEQEVRIYNRKLLDEVERGIKEEKCCVLFLKLE